MQAQEGGSGKRQYKVSERDERGAEASKRLADEEVLFESSPNILHALLSCIFPEYNPNTCRFRMAIVSARGRKAVEVQQRIG